MTAVAAAAVRPAALPRSLLAWLAAATLSSLGDSALYFALGWTATGIGPRWAGLVVTMITLPRTVLLLVGGAVGDRWGPRRVMVCGDAVMCVVTLLLALLAQVDGITVWLLLSTGLTVGIVDAFYLVPAEISSGQVMRHVHTREGCRRGDHVGECRGG